MVGRTGRRPSPVGTAKLGVEQPLSTYPPVLAITLRRRDGGQDKVLVGVRTSHNRTHQNVLSVPTIRVLPEVAAVWRRPLADGVLSTEGLRPGSPVERTVRRVVLELLARKVGLADPLERGEVDVEIEAMLAVQGTSLIGSRNGEDVTENLTMFNAQVRWTSADDPGPARTASYDPLLWITEDQFAEMVRTRDVGVLDAGLDEIEVCVRGLCIESTLRTLGRRVGQDGR